MSKRTDPQLRIRIPKELKIALEKKAKISYRTLTAEVTKRLEKSLKQDGIIF